MRESRHARRGAAIADRVSSLDRAAGARPSLVDSAERALRNWLAPGRHRTGDRLPPEQEVASMLGISRGTLRTALQRLEDTGEIVRRQGSGTFVGRVAVPSQLDERLERLETYSSLARRRGVALSASDLRVEHRAVGPEVGELLELDPEATVTSVFRALHADGEPVAVMFDVIAPSVELPEMRRLERLLEQGEMVLDVLIAAQVAVAFARTRVMPLLAAPREQIGDALRLRKPTAVLELEEVIHAGDGTPVAYSRDVFAPGALDVQVMRSYEASSPTPIAAALGSRRRRGARTARRAV